jgi:ureidoglycolate hydrolase
VAFYFPGDSGFQIAPGTWHQPAYPLGDVAQFKNKQVDTVYKNEKKKKLSIFKTYFLMSASCCFQPSCQICFDLKPNHMVFLEF